MRTATIHYHFPREEDLGVALVADYDQRYDATMADILKATPDGARRIAIYAELYLEGLNQKLGCLCAVLAITPEPLPAAISEDVGRFFRKHLAWLEAVLREGRDDGSIRGDVDPARQARVILCLLEGALLLERMLDGPEGFRSTIEMIENQLRAA